MSKIETLKKYRKQAKITIKDMAGRIGVTPETLSHYENGHRKLPIDKAEKYCSELELELRILIKESND